MSQYQHRICPQEPRLVQVRRTPSRELTRALRLRGRDQRHTWHYYLWCSDDARAKQILALLRKPVGREAVRP